MTRVLICFVLAVGLTAADAPDPFAGAKRLKMVTNHGDVVLEVWPAVAPATVANFVDLAMGTKKGIQRNFFDGLTFHRVIAGFMIQGGCPLGTGTGDPGYKFDDEISAAALGLDKEQTLVGNGLNQRCQYQQRDFMQRVVLPRMAKQGDKAGLPDPERQKIYQTVLAELKKGYPLSEFYTALGYTYKEGLPSQHPVRGALCMANSGPNTNGSQFFINLVDTPHLAGKHTVFGKVAEGLDVIDKIGQQPVGAGAKPNTPVTITSIRVIE